MKLLSTLLLVFSLTFAQAGPLEDIKAQVKDHAKSFTTIVEFKVKPDSIKAFMKLAREAVKNTRKEPGNAMYQIHADAKDPNTLVFLEVWRTMAALEEHAKQEYTTALLSQIGELCEGPPSIRVLTPAFPPVASEPKAPAAAKPAEAAPEK